MARSGRENEDMKIFEVFEQPVHLIAEPGVCFAVAVERPRTSSRLWVRTASVEVQASKSRG